MIVLDTNILSETMRAEPDVRVMRWLSSQHDSRLFITAVSEAEILFGLARLPLGKRRKALEEAASEMFALFQERSLAFDSDAAKVFAEIAAAAEQKGRVVAMADAQIAAIVRARGGTLATRNVNDFATFGISLFNPWE